MRAVARPASARRVSQNSIVFRVGSEQAIEFWETRLAEAGRATARTEHGIQFADPEGLGLELEVYNGPDEPLVADDPEIPSGMALQGFAGVRMYTTDDERGRSLLEDALAFERVGEGRWETRGEHRGAYYDRLPAPDEPGVPGAGTVHHVAWSSPMEEQEAWQRRVAEAGARPTPVIDRFYFKSIYFREPAGVLFEIATQGPGFATDEPADHLGERLSLPPSFEHLRDRLDGILTPLPDPRAGRTPAA